MFDRALTPGPIAASNWSVRYDNALYDVDSAIAVGSQVDLGLGESEGDPGPSVVSYDPPPFDVTSLLGTPAAAFADFPIT